MEINKNSIVGEIVAQDYRAASVFKKHKIDFCCNGNRSIDTVCLTKEIDSTLVIDQLISATTDVEKSTIDYSSWDIDLLADYIEKKHHRFVGRKIPEIRAYLKKIAEVHGDNHPELIEIEQLFDASATELLAHMQKEEQILFPFVRNLADDSVSSKPDFGTIVNPIEMMMHEHDTEGDRFRKIADLSNDYDPPTDACSTYRVAFSMLKEFEADLHLHIHLENNILFPRAIEAEQMLAHV